MIEWAGDQQNMQLKKYRLFKEKPIFPGIHSGTFESTLLLYHH